MEKKNTVPSRRENLYAPSRPVEQEIYTVPSRRDYLYLPSRPVVIIFFYPRPVVKNITLPSRPVMKQNGHCTVPSRPVDKLTPPVPSRPIQASIIFIILPSRHLPSSILFPTNMSKQYRSVPSRILSAMKSPEKKGHARNSHSLCWRKYGA